MHLHIMTRSTIMVYSFFVFSNKEGFNFNVCWSCRNCKYTSSFSFKNVYKNLPWGLGDGRWIWVSRMRRISPFRAHDLPGPKIRVNDPPWVVLVSRNESYCSSPSWISRTSIMSKKVNMGFMVHLFINWQLEIYEPGNNLPDMDTKHDPIPGALLTHIFISLD